MFLPGSTSYVCIWLSLAAGRAVKAVPQVIKVLPVCQGLPWAGHTPREMLCLMGMIHRFWASHEEQADLWLDWSCTPYS